METAAQSAKTQKKWMTWTGRVVSALPVLMMGMGVISVFFQKQKMIEGMAHFGYAADRVSIIFTLEIVALVLFLIPQTAVLGAIFATAYLGGAVATHVRIADPGWPLAVVAGLLVWIGLYLRDARLRELVPFRRLR